VNIQELRAKIGLEDGQLLTNANGEHADILAVDDTHVTLGVLERRDPIRVPIENLVSKKPE